MAVRPARRLPHRFRRTVSKKTRSLVERRVRRRTDMRRERMWRLWRRVKQHLFAGGRMLSRWVLVWAGGLLLLAIGMVLFSPLLHVREVRVQRSDIRLDIDEVQAVLSPVFGRHLAFLSEVEVERMLLSQLPDLREADVMKVYPGTLVVRITLDPVVARLIVDDPETVNPQSASGAGFFLTEEGMMVAYPFLENAAEFPEIRLVDWGARPVHGTALVSQDFLERLFTAERALRERFGQEVTLRVVYLRAREFHVRLRDGPSLWFDMTSPLEDQLQHYRTFLRSVPLEEVREYIDLRLSDRVVYK